jgi:hypothetical protein
MPREVIKLVQWAVRFYKRALGHVKVDHGSGNIGMPQEFFKGYDIESLFKQVGGIRMSERMQVHVFGNGSFFEVFAHHPG